MARLPGNSQLSQAQSWLNVVVRQACKAQKLVPRQIKFTALCMHANSMCAVRTTGVNSNTLYR